MEQYLNILPKQAPAAFEAPKGVLNNGFVRVVCAPVPGWDLRNAVKAAVSLAIAASYVAVSASVLLVPVWLWALRHRMQAAGALLSFSVLPLLLLPPLLFLAADHIVRYDTRRTSQNKASLLTASSVATRPLIAASLHNNSNTRQPNGTAAAAITTSGASSSHQTAPAGAPAAQKHKAQSADWHPVRQAIIKLEYDLYGNELTEGVLPHSQLAVHVERLCSDVGVQLPAGNLTPAVMLQLLTSAREAAGIDEQQVQ
jgi:hypothetical protein